MALDWTQEAISVILMQREDTDNKTSVRNMAYYRPYQEKASVHILKMSFRKVDKIAVSMPLWYPAQNLDKISLLL